MLIPNSKYKTNPATVTQWKRVGNKLKGLGFVPQPRETLKKYRFESEFYFLQ